MVMSMKSSVTECQVVECTTKTQRELAESKGMYSNNIIKGCLKLVELSGITINIKLSGFILVF